ncbi:unnamed protein product, partial [Oikopleura dioica]
ESKNAFSMEKCEKTPHLGTRFCRMSLLTQKSSNMDCSTAILNAKPYEYCESSVYSSPSDCLYTGSTTSAHVLISHFNKFEIVEHTDASFPGVTLVTSSKDESQNVTMIERPEFAANIICKNARFWVAARSENAKPLSYIIKTVKLDQSLILRELDEANFWNFKNNNVSGAFLQENIVLPTLTDLRKRREILRRSQEDAKKKTKDAEQKAKLVASPSSKDGFYVVANINGSFHSAELVELGAHTEIAEALISFLTDSKGTDSAKTSKKRTHSDASLFSVSDSVQKIPSRQSTESNQRSPTIIGDSSSDDQNADVHRTILDWAMKRNVPSVGVRPLKAARRLSVGSTVLPSVNEQDEDNDVFEVPAPVSESAPQTDSNGRTLRRSTRQAVNQPHGTASAIPGSPGGSSERSEGSEYRPPSEVDEPAGSGNNGQPAAGNQDPQLDPARHHHGNIPNHLLTRNRINQTGNSTREGRRHAESTGLGIIQDSYSVIPFFQNDTSQKPSELTLIQTNLTGAYLIGYTLAIANTPKRATHVNGMQPEPEILKQRITEYLTAQTQQLPDEIAAFFGGGGFNGTVDEEKIFYETTLPQLIDQLKTRLNVLFVPELFPRPLKERLFGVSEAPLERSHSLIREDGQTFVVGVSVLAAKADFLFKEDRVLKGNVEALNLFLLHHIPALLCESDLRHLRSSFNSLSCVDSRCKTSGPCLQVRSCVALCILTHGSQ